MTGITPRRRGGSRPTNTPSSEVTQRELYNIII